jgi:hypothetical protein
MNLQAAKEISDIFARGIRGNVAPLLNDLNEPFQVARNVIYVGLSEIWPALLQFIEKFIPMLLEDVFVRHAVLDEAKRPARQSSSLYSSGTSSAGTSRVCTSP